MGERENFEYAMEFVLKNEGGWTVDHAGPTNFGIVLRELQRTGEDLTGDGAVDVQDLRGMTREQAKDWYRRHRWLPGRYGEIQDRGVAAKVFDCAVNMGAREAHVILQRALGATGYPVAVDGVLGPKTLGAVNVALPAALLAALRSEMAGVYRLILAGDRNKFGKYEKGWLERAYK